MLLKDLQAVLMGSNTSTVATKLSLFTKLVIAAGENILYLRVYFGDTDPPYLPDIGSIDRVSPVYNIRIFVLWGQGYVSAVV